MLLRYMDVVSPLSPPFYVFCTLLLYILLLYYFQARIMPPKRSATRSRKRTAKVSVPTVPSKRPVGARSKANKTSILSSSVEPKSTLPDRTSAQANHGSLNVDLGALSSTITAAISQGLREAGLVPPLASTDLVDGVGATRGERGHFTGCGGDYCNAWGYVLSG